MMKKLLAVVCVVVLVLSLTACGKFTCDICGQEKSGKKHTKTIEGVTATYCDDCKPLVDLALSLGDF